jgi:hypothetical protein
MVDEIDATPRAIAVHTDLRMLPSLEIVYLPKGSISPAPWFGEVRKLFWDKSTKKVMAHVVVTSMGLSGINNGLTDKPFGKNKPDHWYFRTPTEQHKIVLQNLGYEMTEEEMKPDWAGLKRIRPPADELVKQVMEKAFHDGGFDTTAEPGLSGTAEAGAKHHKARTA